jgi:hypothetical protein
MAVALIALFIALTGSAAAVTVTYAQNSDKVDGKHAVSSSASVSQRRGKLVATSGTTGLLPSNIVPQPGYVTVTGAVATMGAFGSDTGVGLSQAFCPAGKVPVGGGWRGDPDFPTWDAALLDNSPAGNSWYVIMANFDSVSAKYSAYAVCAPGSTSGSAGLARATFTRRVAALRQELDAR